MKTSTSILAAAALVAGVFASAPEATAAPACHKPKPSTPVQIQQRNQDRILARNRDRAIAKLAAEIHEDSLKTTTEIVGTNPTGPAYVPQPEYLKADKKKRDGKAMQVLLKVKILELRRNP